MARSVIKELVVKIMGDDKNLQKASGRSTAAMGRIAKRAAQIGKQLALAGAAGTVALGALVARAIATADQAGKTAASIGTTVETLTALRHAADLSGVSNESLEKGLAKMARASSDAAAGLATQKAAFDTLGISVTDTEGRLRPQRELLGDLADQFAAMEDGTRKTALAQEVLGRAGTELIPMLNQGRAGLAEMTEEAERLGLVIDEDTAMAAAAFRDNLTRLKGVMTGVVNKVSQAVLPILVDLSNRFVDSSQKGGGFTGAIEKAETALRSLLTAAAIVRGVLTAVGETLGGVAAAISLAIEGKFRAAFNALKQVPSDAIANFRRGVDDIQTIWDELGKNVEASAPRIGAQVAAPAVEARTIVQTEAEKMADKVNALVLGLQQEHETLGMTAEQLTRYKLEALGASEQTIEFAITMQRLNDATESAVDHQEELRKKGEALTEQYRTADETFVLAQEHYNELLEAGTITTGIWSRAMADAKDQMVDAGAAAEDFGVTFSESLEQAALSGKLSFAGFAQSVLADLQRILVKALIVRAVAFFLPGVGSAAALISANLGALRQAGMQHGGPAEAGRPYLVGERGPELFVPRSSGQVVPSGGALRLDAGSLPPYPRAMSPQELALDGWWREAFGHLVVDGLERGVRFSSP